jgi:retron-type reverse transcriptase
VEPQFHPDSYGYRPGKSALDAVGMARQRCWRRDWVLDLDIKAFFGSIPHADLLKSVARRIVDRRVLHLIKMWLEMSRGRNRPTGPDDTHDGGPG